MNNGSNSSTELQAAARDILERNGFSEITQHQLAGFDNSSNCMFEDAYSIVSIVFYSTWDDLKRNWQLAQTAFVELISEHISRDEQKSWEGYLMLWTTDFVPFSEIEYRQQIQYNTGRVRKLISSGEHLKEIGDVYHALLPLLPITESFDQAADDSVLKRIPELLQTSTLPKGKIQAVVNAFEKQESLMEAMHDSDEGSL